MALRSVFLMVIAALPYTQSNMYDVIEKHKLPPPECRQGCAAWADVAKTNANVTGMWAASKTKAEGEVPKEAGSYCAIPGMVGGRTGMAAGNTAPDVMSADDGSFCFCKDTMEPHYCISAHGVPEQINLQIASSTTIVAGFVTFETVMPADPPIAEFGMAALPGSPSFWQETPTQIKGVSHWYMEKSNATCGGGAGPCAKIGRNYTMSFVKFHDLKPGTNYTYRVKSGSKSATWSDTFTFRAPVVDGDVAKLGVYGDMGVYAWNNMQNLQEDCQNGNIDAIVHMGDHVYFWAGGDNKRGDAYMNAWQPALAQCPWMPIIGNHEYNDADNSWRYINETWGPAYGQENNVGDVMPDEELWSQTDTAVGHFMTRHNLYAQGTHGATPSGTSRWYSINIGNIHLVGLDLGQTGSGTGPGKLAETPGPWADREAKQIAWLKQDLTAVDRTVTPWVMVMSHFPLYHTSLDVNAEMSADWYTGAKAEFKTGDEEGEFKPCENGNSCTTVREHLAPIRAILDPIFEEHGVDFYNAGHVHDYTTNWPMNRGVVTQRNYSNPTGTIHICEGNGGVPQAKLPHGPAPCGSEFCRIHTRDPAYGRWTAFNASYLRYEHIPNDPGHVDNGEIWIVTQDKHGLFNGTRATGD